MRCGMLVPFFQKHRVDVLPLSDLESANVGSRQLQRDQLHGSSIVVHSTNSSSVMHPAAIFELGELHTEPHRRRLDVAWRCDGVRRSWRTTTNEKENGCGRRCPDGCGFNILHSRACGLRARTTAFSTIVPWPHSRIRISELCRLGRWNWLLATFISWCGFMAVSNDLSELQRLCQSPTGLTIRREATANLWIESDREVTEPPADLTEPYPISGANSLSGCSDPQRSASSWKIGFEYSGFSATSFGTVTAVNPFAL